MCDDDYCYSAAEWDDLVETRDFLEGRVLYLEGRVEHLIGELRAALAGEPEDSWGTGKSNRELLAEMESEPPTTCPTCDLLRAGGIDPAGTFCLDPWHTVPTGTEETP